jgi:hypothetical protein
VLHPALVPHPKIDDKIFKFIKFGNPPPQEVLFKWILSRTEIQWGDIPSVVLGGFTHTSSDNIGQKHSNTFSKTVAASQSRVHIHDMQVQVNDHMNETNSLPNASLNDSSKYHYDTDNFELTKKLIGNSRALEMLKQSNNIPTYHNRSTTKRLGATRSANISNMTSIQFKLGTNIEKIREEISNAMEVRRRTIEISNTRRLQMADKYGKIKDQIKQEKNVCQDVLLL